MAFPVYKSRDADNIRVYAEEIRPDVWRFTHRQGVTATKVYELLGDEAQRQLATYRAADSLSFMRYYAGPRPQLAHTGRPSRLPFRAAVVAASVTTVAAVAVAIAPDAQTPTPRLSDVVSAPVVTPSPASPHPYRPEPRPAPHTSRSGKRESLTPSPSASLAAPSPTSRTERPRTTQPPADIRISFYQVCEKAPQPCIDAGALTMYAGRILAGHNYMGYQWLATVPVGRTVRVISGPLAGTYRAYTHMHVNRQGGAIPDFGSADLVLQTCVGSGTGFTLLHRT
ncbi:MULTISPECIES: hypothetical protein [unclassified Streptomyces]|uniref:hypothetical protein n=1 Tax=unclassified Streptomyces TaxID=2593676 RepID=UPI003D73665B